MLNKSCYTLTLKTRIIPEYITDLTMLNAHNARVFIVLFLLSFLFIDALKFNLHECKEIQQKYYSIIYATSLKIFYFRNDTLGLILKMKFISQSRKIKPSMPNISKKKNILKTEILSYPKVYKPICFDKCISNRERNSVPFSP